MMIARRILAAVILLWAFPCFAQTGSVKTPSQLSAEINTTFPDNSVGQITPFGLRQVTLDQAASVPFLNFTNVFSAIQAFPNGVTITGGTISGSAITGGTITGLPTPVNPSDAVTLSYVNAAVTTGINILAPSRLATAAILPNSPTYNNGTAGVGATLTAGSNSTLTVDGTVANLNDIVLVKNQGSAFQNGIYSLTTAGSGAAAWVLTRVSYFNIASQMKVGSYTFITAGTANANASYTLQSTVVTVGTDALTWALFSSTGTAVTSLDGTNGNISVQAGSLKVVSGQLSGNVLSSRAFAQTQNLSAFSAVRTLGYAAAGDGGGATFQKVSGVPFRDTFISSEAITGGSGYVNGTYNGVPFGGGQGLGCGGEAIVSGGAVTTVIFDAPCSGYAVGDVLTTTNSFLGGSGSGFSFTVSGITAPGASFTDASSNTFQFVTDDGNFANVKQFGAKMDYNGVDAGSTNDMASYLSAMAWASFPYSGSAALVNGTTVIVPKGASFLCGGTLLIPQAVILRGSGVGGGSTLKECTSESANTNFITLCSNLLTRGQFPCAIKDITIKADGPANSNIAAIYSTGAQQWPLVDNVLIVPGLRTCITYGIGIGGASNAEFLNGDCESDGTSSNPGIVILSTVGSTQVIFQNWVVECGSCTNNKIGFAVSGGFFVAENIQFEKIYEGFVINSPNPASIKNVVDQATGTCNFVIQSTALNPVGNTIMENISPDTCPTTFANGRAGGSITGYIGASTAK